MKKINVINKCTLLLGSITVMIGDVALNMKRGEIKAIELPEGKYSVRVEKSWISGKREISIDNNNINLVIKLSIPDSFYALTFGILILLYTLNFLSIIDTLIPSIYSIVVVLFFSYMCTFRAKKYFSISVIK